MTTTPAPAALALGEELARAIADKDEAWVRSLLHPELSFMAMTPRKVWEAQSHDDVLNAFTTWFGEDQIEQIEKLETDSFADRARVGYRLRIRNADGVHLVEQQMYLSEQDGQISWLRIMCAGKRPIEG